MTNISYSGEVTVTVKHRKIVKKHNAGTHVLFNSLYNFLTGAVSSIGDLYPTQMSVLAESVDTDKGVNYSSYTPCLSSPLLITSRELVKTDKGETSGIKLTSVLSTSYLISNSLNSDNVTIVLLDSSKQIMAYSVVSSSNFTPLEEDANAQVIIDWDMSFSNSKEDQ